MAKVEWAQWMGFGREVGGVEHGMGTLDARQNH